MYARVCVSVHVIQIHVYMGERKDGLVMLLVGHTSCSPRITSATKNVHCTCSALHV